MNDVMHERQTFHLLLEPAGRWAGEAREGVGVLARSVPETEAADLSGGRELAESFCRKLCDIAAANAELDTTTVCAVVRAALRADTARRSWKLAFSAMLVRGSSVRLFSCGSHGIGLWSSKGFSTLLRPQSMAEQLRAQGQAAPEFTERLSTTLAADDCAPEQVAHRDVLLAPDQALVVLADMRFAELLAEAQYAPANLCYGLRGVVELSQVHFSQPDLTMLAYVG